MAISPLAQTPAPAPSPTQQAQSMGQRAAEMEQEQTPAQSIATSAMDEVRLEREKLNRAMERMLESLDRRKSMPFDPMLMQMSAAFLKPTKTGSFGESLGFAAEAAAGEAEKEYARNQAQAKLELELQQKLLESKQKGAGAEMLQGMFPGMQQPAPMVKPPAPGGIPGAAPPAAPAAAPGQPPAGPTAQADPMRILQPAIGGMRKVTLADIQLARQYADPDTVKFLENALKTQQETEKIGIQERGLEFTIPGTRRVIKNIPLEEQREAQAMYQRSLSSGDPQMYFRYLVQKGWIEPEFGEPEPTGERKLLPPMSPEQEEVAKKRGAARAEAEEKARQDLMAAGRLAGTIARDSDQVIKFASDPKTQGAFGQLSDSGLVNAFLILIREGVRTGSGSISMPAVEEALRTAGKGKTEIDAAKYAMQSIVNMELNFTRIFLAGGGQITEGERAIVRNLPPSLTDSPKVAIAKSEALKARAKFDEERSREFRAWEKRNPRLGFDDFQDSKEYKKLEKDYDNQLFKIRETYFPSTPSAPAGGKGEGPLERSIRGG